MDLETLRQEYNKLEPRYKQLKEEVLSIIVGELERSNIPYHVLEGRIKTFDSLEAKAKQQEAIASLEDVVDICGVRVICLFRSDIERIGEIIYAQFDVDTKDDKLLSMSQQEFGYFSVHYVSRLPKRYAGPRYDEIKGLRFEVQVRTIAMHAWATVSHYLAYKSSLSVPSNLKKDFSALSALFHLADSQFESFAQASQEAKRSAEAKADKADKASDLLDAEINLHTLTEYLKWKYPDREHAVASTISTLAEELVLKKYVTIADLDSDLEKCSEILPMFEQEASLMTFFERQYDLGAVYISLGILDEEYATHTGIAAIPGRRQLLQKCRKLLKD